MSGELRAQFEESLKSDLQFQLFEEVVKQTAHAIYITDTEGVIEYVNPAFEQITGYDADEAIGTPSSLLQSGEHDDEWYDDLWETILAGEQWQREMIDRTKSGEEIILEQTISPITNTDGEIEKFVAIAQDVTARKTHQKRLEAQRDDLELLNHVLRHDIRNDLQLVTAYAELLEDHVDEEGQAYLDTVRESAENAVALTSTAKEMADVMLQTTAENTPVNLAATLNHQLDEVRDTYTDAVVTVDSSIPDVTVLANDLLGSVFRNLLKNAIQHNDKPVPKISVSAAESDDHVTVRIADNGPGIPEGQRSELFGKGAKGLKSAGTGIGLYLVSSLVDSYDGEVWHEANDPEGSVFVVELPTVEDP